MSYFALTFLKPTTWWQALALAISLGLSMAAVGFNIQHDGSHHAYSDRRWVNTLMAMSLDLLGGSSYVWARKHNVVHHSFSNITGHDDDINIGFFGRLSPHQKRMKIHGCRKALLSVGALRIFADQVATLRRLSRRGPGPNRGTQIRPPDGLGPRHLRRRQTDVSPPGIRRPAVAAPCVGGAAPLRCGHVRPRSGPQHRLSIGALRRGCGLSASEGRDLPDGIRLGRAPDRNDGRFRSGQPTAVGSRGRPEFPNRTPSLPPHLSPALSVSGASGSKPRAANSAYGMSPTTRSAQGMASHFRLAVLPPSAYFLCVYTIARIRGGAGGAGL